MDLFTLLLAQKNGIKSTKLWEESFEFDELVSTAETPAPGDASPTTVGKPSPTNPKGFDFETDGGNYRFYIMFLYREPQEGDSFTEPTTWGGFSMSCIMRNKLGRIYSSGSMIARGTAPLNFVYNTTGNDSNPIAYSSYGVNIVNQGGTNQITINRKCHATNMKYIPGGTYKVVIYGIDSL